jgi:prepilin-type N-terminal cleavage/methylation domain-containing protein
MTPTGTKKGQKGYSILELLISMTIMLMVMGIVSMVFGRAMGVRSRESRKTDALTSAQAVLNVMSREIANSGFGLIGDAANRVPNNGIVLADSDAHRIRIRANLTNSRAYTDPTAPATSDPGEDIAYYLDGATSSIVRYDANAVAPTPKTSVVVNRISSVTFDYVNYTAGSSATTTTAVPTQTTGRVIITVVVMLEPVAGQANPATVTFTSDVALRNANYMLQQY